MVRGDVPLLSDIGCQVKQLNRSAKHGNANTLPVAEAHGLR